MLENTGLCKTYPGGHKALSDFAFKEAQHERIVLLGPNGAGKTAFIKILARLLLSDAGRLLFAGERLERRHPNEIGCLFEGAENLMQTYP